MLWLIAFTGCFIEERSPAEDGGAVFLAPASCAVAVLELREDERTDKFGVGGEGDFEFAHISATGGDDDGSVCRVASIEGGSGCSCEHGYAFDVVRVEVGDALGLSTRAEFHIATASEVIHRDAVDDVEGIAALFDGLGASHHDFAGSTDAGRTAVDCDSCDFSVEGVDEVGVFDGEKLFGFYLLDIVAQGFLFTAKSECGDNDFVQNIDVFAHLNVMGGFSRNADSYALESEVAENESVGGEGFNAVASVNVGDCSRFFAFDRNACPHESFVVSVCDTSCDCVGLRLRRHWFRDDFDVAVFDFEAALCPRKDLSEGFAKRSILEAEVHGWRSLKCRVVVADGKPGLALDFFKCVNHRDSLFL